jgi:hypothetical protein
MTRKAKPRPKMTRKAKPRSIRSIWDVTIPAGKPSESHRMADLPKDHIVSLSPVRDISGMRNAKTIYTITRQDGSKKVLEVQQKNQIDYGKIIDVQVVRSNLRDTVRGQVEVWCYRGPNPFPPRR